MNEEKFTPIVFERKRDFSEIINSTFEFIKREILNPRNAFLKTLLPLLFAITLLQNIIIFSVNEFSDITFFFKKESVDIIISLPFILISSILLTSFCYSFIKNYIDNKGVIDNLMVFKLSWKKFFPVLGYQIAIILLSGLGFLFLVLPGIYLIVLFSLVLPILFFKKSENDTIIEKSFKLMKGHWWESFGVYLLTLVIYYIIYLILSVPLLACAFLNVKTELPILYYSVSTIVTTLIMILYSIFPVLFSFQYFNLRERQEYTSLTNKVSEMEASQNNSETLE